MSNWDKNVEGIRGNIIKLIVPKNINENRIDVNVP